MYIEFLNSDYEVIFLLDSFESLIWIDRYWEHGNVDIIVDPNETILNALANTAYFKIPESDHWMMNEAKGIESDIEKGDTLVIQGRSLEAILEKRIVWNLTALDDDLDSAINDLITQNIISASDADRRLPTILGWLSSGDSSITSINVKTQFHGENLYAAIKDLCRSNGVGFKITYLGTTSAFWFQLYNGKDRSFDQTTNQPVAFTSKLNNLLNANYVESGTPEKNVCLVAGESGVGNVKTLVEVGSGVGLARKEVYLEASINRRTPTGSMTDAEYLLALEGKGQEELAKRPYLEAFDGEVDTTMYNFGDEFNMGDILQIADDYGHGTKSRVIEMVYSQNKEGIKMYPTFETVE